MNESAILTSILNRLGRLPHVRLWRNNIGKLQDRNGRWIAYGVCNPGGSDLLGYTSIVVTPDMVGRRLAILTCIECKSEKGRIRTEQNTFLEHCHQAGAFAGVARTVEQAEQICNQLDP